MAVLPVLFRGGALAFTFSELGRSPTASGVFPTGREDVGVLAPATVIIGEVLQAMSASL